MHTLKNMSKESSYDATQAEKNCVQKIARKKRGAESKRWKESERVWTTMAAENIEKWDMSTNEIGYAVALQQFDSYLSCMHVQCVRTLVRMRRYGVSGLCRVRFWCAERYVFQYTLLPVATYVFTPSNSEHKRLTKNCFGGKRCI